MERNQDLTSDLGHVLFVLKKDIPHRLIELGQDRLENYVYSLMLCFNMFLRMV